MRPIDKMLTVLIATRNGAKTLPEVLGSFCTLSAPPAPGTRHSSRAGRREARLSVTRDDE